jgi:hypothetical protein
MTIASIQFCIIDFFVSFWGHPWKGYYTCEKYDSAFSMTNISICQCSKKFTYTNFDHNLQL